ncbi:hypothetical protein [Sulfitobacter sp.]|jgi:hypothetical protein|uniref:hypothetical protein n=1 Tax=Sulfitobacter sp. TaxID=1903071 RepID=UPI00300288E8
MEKRFFSEHDICRKFIMPALAEGKEGYHRGGSIPRCIAGKHHELIDIGVIMMPDVRPLLCAA